MPSKNKAAIKRLIFLLNDERLTLAGKLNVFANQAFKYFANCEFNDTNFVADDRVALKRQLDLAFVGFWEKVASQVVASIAKGDFDKNYLYILKKFTVHKRVHAKQTSKMLPLNADDSMHLMSGLISLQMRLEYIESRLVDCMWAIFNHQEEQQLPQHAPNIDNDQKELPQHAPNIDNDQKELPQHAPNIEFNKFGYYIVSALTCIINNSISIHDQGVLDCLTRNFSLLRTSFVAEPPHAPKLLADPADFHALSSLLRSIYCRLAENNAIPNATLIVCLDAMCTLHTCFDDFSLGGAGIEHLNKYVQLFISRINIAQPYTAFQIMLLADTLQKFTDKLQHKIITTENLNALGFNFGVAAMRYPLDNGIWFQFSAAFDNLAKYDENMPQHTANIKKFSPTLQFSKPHPAVAERPVERYERRVVCQFNG